MNNRLLNVTIASIRFDRVPAAVTSSIFERTVLPLYGDVLEWEYAKRRNFSQSQFEARVTRDLNGMIGVEVLRLCRLGLFPVLCVQFFCWEWLYGRTRIEMDYATLRKLAQKQRSIVMTFPSIRSNEQYGFHFSYKFIELLARYEFSLEIV